MQAASRQCADKHKNASSGSAESHLFIVANTFVQFQEKRHAADYDISKAFDPIEVALDISAAENAFATWDKIRNEPIAQEYLFSLLFKERS